MRLVDDNGKLFLFEPRHAVYDIRKFLYGRCDDFRISLQCNGKVCGRTFIVHHADQSRFMLHAENRVLQLPVHDNAVGHNDDIVENHLIFGIVHGSQPVREPRDRVRFARTCAVLNQVILRRAVLLHIGKQLADNIQLMIPRKNDALFDLSFPGKFVLFFLRLNKDKPKDEVN